MNETVDRRNPSKAASALVGAPVAGGILPAATQDATPAATIPDRYRHDRQRRPLRAVLLALMLSLGGSASGMAQDDATQAAGTVYAMTNALAGNEVIAYDRAEDGALSPAGRFATEGMGSGSFENSDGALIVASVEGQSSPVDLGGGNDLVYAVNAGSDSISVFRATDQGLELVDVEPSGGERPTSLTLHSGRLFVLNSAGDAGGAGLCFGGHPSITGFTVAESGALEPIVGSTRALTGGPMSGCAQVSFTPAGDQLVVTEITANTILTIAVDAAGMPAAEANAHAPIGNGPFGFTFDGEGRLFVTENAQAAPGAGTVGSYTIDAAGEVVPIGEAVPIGETDPCWILVTPDGRYAFVTNFGPSGLLTLPSEDLRRGTVASFRVGEDGALELLDPQAALLGVGAADIALGGDGRFLYALNSVEGTVSGFEIGQDGSLTEITTVNDLPTNPLSPLPIPMGLAARDNG